MSAAAKLRVAYFVTPHGYGHAARAAAVMSALYDLEPRLSFDIYTRVEEWFFREALKAPFRYHDLDSDVGVVQTTPLEEDLNATLGRLRNFLPFNAALLADLAGNLRRDNCRAVLCDIAPLGIAAADEAGLPSVLIENFTWDWIYSGYLQERPEFAPAIAYLSDMYRRANLHIQTEPACLPGNVDLIAPPVSRKPRKSRQAIRNELRLPQDARIVLITMGGVQGQFPFLERLSGDPGCYFVIPGASERMERRANLILLPHHSRFYHPDLVAASDLVVGKIGYSTLAETYHAGVPFAYVSRARFREAPVLASFVEEHMPGGSIAPAEFESGVWGKRLHEFFVTSKVERHDPNGAEVIARFLLERLPV